MYLRTEGEHFHVILFSWTALIMVQLQAFKETS